MAEKSYQPIRIYKNLFDKNKLYQIKEFYTKFYLRNKKNLWQIFESGIDKNDFYHGFYFLIQNNEGINAFREGKSINQELQKDLKQNTINLDHKEYIYQKIKFHRPDKKSFQYAYTIEMPDFQETKNLLNEISNTMVKNNFPVSTQSIACTMQESGHMIHVHKDAGVSSRYHIVLNEGISDYFYLENIGHKVDFGDCFFIDTSQINHTFMHFSNSLRIHLMYDVLK